MYLYRYKGKIFGGITAEIERTHARKRAQASEAHTPPTPQSYRLFLMHFYASSSNCTYSCIFDINIRDVHCNEREGGGGDAPVT